MHLPGSGVGVVAEKKDSADAVTGRIGLEVSLVLGTCIRGCRTVCQLLLFFHCIIHHLHVDVHSSIAIIIIVDHV